MLRAAGAVILGKTATGELAVGAPGKTRNPHDPERTAGGPSGGSAAAVAAEMSLLALGTETGGSTIGSASFCGVYGFKPTHGLIPRHGILALSRTLDQVGLFARSVEDLALFAAQLVGYDERDRDTRPRARIPFVKVASDEPPAPPMFAFVKTPHWDEADEDTRAAFAELAGRLGDRVEEVELSASADAAWGWHTTIADVEIAVNLEREWEKGRERMSEELRARIERGRRLGARDYLRALAGIGPLHEGFLELFEQRYDAILTLAAAGTAPRALASSPDLAFCTPWTLCGMPAISVPLMEGANGLPIGVQLVGPRHGDARLLRTARRLAAGLTLA
jgi:Asp-tRNA(Asn)/Glu-tRNA(Gln) amidotransferase A subunit family amidase